jgi:predicted tellurium resistance membrane protein TerC
MAVSNLIAKKLDQPASKSKKALYAGLAGLGVVIVFLFSAFLILKHSEVSREIVELATTAIMAFMALAVTLITGQSAFDWKAVSALQHMDEDVHETVSSNQPVNQLDISHERSPKDFLRDFPF